MTGLGLLTGLLTLYVCAVVSSSLTGNAFRVSETPLLSVHAAMRMAAPEKARGWKIKNPAVINPITGQPVSFKLIPTTSKCSRLGCETASMAAVLQCACLPGAVWRFAQTSPKAAALAHMGRRLLALPLLLLPVVLLLQTCRC